MFQPVIHPISAALYLFYSSMKAYGKARTDMPPNIMSTSTNLAKM